MPAVDSTNFLMWPNDNGLLGDSSGGSTFYFEILNNSIGMSFCPVLDNWNEVAQYGSTIEVQPVDAYTIDSVRIHGAYRRNFAKPLPVDTLVLSLVYGNGSNTTNLQERSISSSPGWDLLTDYGYPTLNMLSMAYDSINNVAKNFTGVATPAYIQKVPLYAADTSLNMDRAIVLTTPLSVPAGYSAAAAISFISGDASFHAGDTVVHASGSYKYGAFLPAVMYAGNATTAYFPSYDPIDSNVGYLAQATGYDSYFPQQYLPTWAWGDGFGGPTYFQYPEIDFHITCATCATNDSLGGSKSVCVGATTNLTYPAGGGTWSSSSVGVATVSTTGVVTGVSNGTSTISYVFSGHYVTATVTVSPAPVAGTISGASAVCVGSSITLSDSPAGGVWVSSVPSAATVGSATGTVIGMLSGIAGISYTVSNSCGSATVVHVVTVDVFGAGTVSGTPTLCVGSSYSFMDATAGGVWSSSSAGVAIVGSSGVVTGIGTGTSIISYTVANACGTAYATAVVSVDVSPAISPITGTLTVCTGLTTSLTDATPGGTWNSENTSIATVGTSGAVTGTGTGICAISYTITSGCGVSTELVIVTVNTTPVVPGISGPSAVCIGSSIDLTDGSSGGSWNSAATGIATVVGSTGVVTGISTGSAVISYTISNSCGTATATVNIAVSTAPRLALSPAQQAYVFLHLLVYLTWLQVALGVQQMATHSYPAREWYSGYLRVLTQ